MNERDLDFLFEVGSHRNMARGWKQHLGTDVASNLEHSFRVVMIALLLARKEKITDEEKVIKMALLHDLAESRVSDLSIVQKVYVKADENRAFKDLIAGTSFPDFKDVMHEYEERKSPESRIVKDADNLDIEVELKELEERGSKLPDRWKHFRKKIRNEKLYTESAKKLWDMLQTADVARWHLETNKWVLMPEAGK